MYNSLQLYYNYNLYYFKNKINDYQGIFSNPESYTVDFELLNEFDKAFPPKIKEKIEGQLE